MTWVPQNWVMPAETAPQDRIWMAFPRESATLGEGTLAREAGYRAWADVALAIAPFQPVTMIVDPTEMARAKKMLGSAVELVERPLEHFWTRDSGPTFVHTPDGSLAAVDWVYNAWGSDDPGEWQNDRGLARFIAGLAGVPVVSSLLVNEGGGIHVDGEGTVFATETVQLDPRRNPLADHARVEAEFARTLGAEKVIWLPQGLAGDYWEFGTNGHVDIVATFPSPGKVLLHDQRNPGHPDHRVMAEIRAILEGATDAKGRRLEIIPVPAPETITDAHGFNDWSYINHLVLNGAVIACGFGEPRADAEAADILAAAYPGRRVVTVDAREIFARGGGVHCITQHQPSARKSAAPQ